jgi:anti-sigma28 factor (negative regulator of flagellin synthesis)
MAVARAALAKVPDIRTAKVRALKAKLDSDTYNPDGEAVADNLVKEYTPGRRDP